MVRRVRAWDRKVGREDMMGRVRTLDRKVGRGTLWER
jgi:hypothetical protein